MQDYSPMYVKEENVHMLFGSSNFPMNPLNVCWLVGWLVGPSRRFGSVVRQMEVTLPMILSEHMFMSRCRERLAIRD